MYLFLFRLITILLNLNFALQTLHQTADFCLNLFLYLIFLPILKIDSIDFHMLLGSFSVLPLRNLTDVIYPVHSTLFHFTVLFLLFDMFPQSKHTLG